MTIKKLQRKIKRVITLSLAMIMMCTSFSYAKDELKTNEENVNTECIADLVYDMSTGELLFSKNINKKLYPASTTKLMTGLLAIEYGDFNDTITFNSDSVNLEVNSSNLGFVSGEKITLKNLLYGLMLKSANEAANQLAYYIKDKSGLSYHDAVDKKLNEIGAHDSSFTSPSGLHKDNHYTTPYDMMLIAKAAFNNEEFRKIFESTSYVIPKTNKAGEREVFNTHKMMFSTSPYHIDGVLGGKTGYTEEAGHCLVTFFNNDELNLLVVTMNGETYFNDTKAIIKYLKDNYETKKFFTKGEYFTTLPVCDESGIKIDQLELTLSEDLNLTVPKDWADDYKVTLVKDYLKKQKEENDRLEKQEKELLDDDKENDDEKESTDESEDNSNEEKNDEDTSIDDEDIDTSDEKLEEYNLTNKYLMHIFDYENDLFEITLDLPENITDTVLENDIVGRINIKYNSGEEKNINIISKGNYDLTNSIDLTILYWILFTAFLIILIIYIKKMIELYKEENEIKNK